MNRDAKRINPNSVGAISRVEMYILDSGKNGFDGDGYVFKKAISNLRKRGHTIKYNREKCSYFLIEK